jgi:adenylate cyclase
MAFCGRCGAALVRECGRCAFVNPPEFSYCGKCGAALSSAAGPGRERTLMDEVPRHLAERIAAARTTLEGERRPVTVLLVDLKGPTELALELDGEEWREILDGFFRIVRTAVHRFEGTVDRYAGDSMMALFGAPLVHDDHAQRACLAALHLRDALRRHSEELRRTRGLAFHARIALHSGEISIARIGDDLRVEYAAHGQTVGLASRLLHLAHPGSVYVAEGTRTALGEAFRLRDLGAFELLGSRAPIRVYELEGTGLRPTPAGLAGARRKTRMVGRDAELAFLEAALARARAGEPQLVGISGEDGVGKTRLCEEFIERCRSRHTTVITARCASHDRTASLAFLMQTLRAHFGVTEDDDPELSRDKITGRLLRADGCLAPDVPLMLDLLGVPDPARPPLRLDPNERQRRCREILVALTAARARLAPLVIVLEDMHWIDAASDAILSAPLASAKCLLIQTFRTGYAARARDLPGYRELVLRPLEGELEEALGQLLGPAARDADLVATLEEASGGNPLFAEELVRELADQGALTGERGDYRVSGAAAEVEVPTTVRAAIAERIERLSERDRRVLQAASVLGPAFPSRHLHEIAEIVDGDLEESLRTLVDAELLVQDAVFPEPRYVFRHPLTQEVAYASLSGAWLRRLHHAVAVLLERHHAERLDERASLIAHHLERAERLEEAAHWHSRAAEWIGSSDAGECARHWRRVDELAEGSPESRDTLALSATACARLLWYATRTGIAPKESANLFHRGEEAARRSSNLHALAQIQNAYGVARHYAGHVRDSLDLLEDAVRTADRVRDPGLRAATRSALLVAMHHTRRIEEELRLVDELLGLSDGDVRLGAAVAGFSPYLVTEVVRARALLASGQVREARRQLERADHLVETYRDVTAEAVLLLEWLHHARARGERPDLVARARAHAARVAGGPLVAERLATAVLGWALLLEGEVRDAGDVLASALAACRADHAVLHMEPFLLIGLAIARLELGDAESARLVVEEAVTCARVRATRDFECQAQIIRATVLRRTQGRHAEEAIAAAVERAAWLVERTGHRVHAPAIREERARLAGLRSEPAVFAQELREAHRAYMEIDAWGHAARLAGELAS